MSDFTIVFDGGSLSNPGRGYGSYAIKAGEGPWATPVRLEFGDRVTNNEAEYRALIAGLTDLAASASDPSRLTVDVLGDSQLVLNHLRGAWKVRAGNLRPLHAAAAAAAARFKAVRYTWHPRERSVRLLGH